MGVYMGVYGVCIFGMDVGGVYISAYMVRAAVMSCEHRAVIYGAGQHSYVTTWYETMFVPF